MLCLLLLRVVRETLPAPGSNRPSLSSLTCTDPIYSRLKNKLRSLKSDDFPQHDSQAEDYVYYSVESPEPAAFTENNTNNTFFRFSYRVATVTVTGYIERFQMWM